MQAIVKCPGEPARLVDLTPTLEQLQAIVGGTIDVVRVSDTISCYVHDEGLLLDLAPNVRLTCPDGRTFDLVGPIVFLGGPDDEGEDTPLLNEDAVAILLAINGISN